MKQAIILAGGKGERLRPLTDNVPKPMVEVIDNKPLLAITLGWLQRQGIEDVIICCGYLHQVIVDYVGDGSKFGLNVDYSIEKEPLGRGGALKRALELLKPTASVLAMNGDLLTSLRIEDLAEFHSKGNSMATVVATKLVSPYGILEVGDNSCINAFREKPTLPYWMNAGIYALQPDIAELLPHVGDHETTTFPVLASKGLLRAYLTEAFWKTVDTMKDVSDLKNASDVVKQVVAIS